MTLQKRRQTAPEPIQFVEIVEGWPLTTFAQPVSQFKMAVRLVRIVDIHSWALNNVPQHLKKLFLDTAFSIGS